MSEVLWSHQDNERDLVRLESWCEDPGSRYRYTMVTEASRSGDATMVGLDTDALTRLYNAAGSELARRNGLSEPAPAPDAAPTNAELTERVSQLHEWAPGADRRMDRLDSHTRATHDLAKTAHTRLNAEQGIRQQREQDVDRRLAEAGEQMRQMREQIVRIEESMRRSARVIVDAIRQDTDVEDPDQISGGEPRHESYDEPEQAEPEPQHVQCPVTGCNELRSPGPRMALHISGSHPDIKSEPEQDEPEQAEPEQAARCQCGHHFREHEGRTNACTATWTIPPSVCSCSRFRLER